MSAHLITLIRQKLEGDLLVANELHVRLHIIAAHSQHCMCDILLLMTPLWSPSMSQTATREALSADIETMRQDAGLGQAFLEDGSAAMYKAWG